MPNKPTLDNVSHVVWTKCFGIKPEERALVVTDRQTLEIAGSLLDTGRKLCNCDLVEVTGMKMHGQEPPAQIAEKLQDYSAIVAPMTFSITHTKAVYDACQRGSRVITMPGVTRDMYLRTVLIDYKKLYEANEALISKLEGSEFRIGTSRGTYIYLRRDDRKIHNCCGVPKAGKVLNLPDGEVAFAPIEGKAEGRIVVDVSSAPDTETAFGRIGIVRRPFTITVEGGEAVDCDNEVLWKALTSVDDGVNLAELGLGTNPRARITGRILEDEKITGTGHIAFGSNKDLGGTVQTAIHLDSVFSKPTIEVDGAIVIREGRF